MSTFWLTFRFEDETINGKTYHQRYDAFIDKLDKLASKWWVEPTSFIAFESTSTLDQIAGHLKFTIAPSKDVFLIRAMDEKDARVVGNLGNATIFSLMPYLKKA